MAGANHVLEIIRMYTEDLQNEIRLGFIGDHYAGKTAFLHVYTEKKNPDTYKYHLEVYEDHRLESKVHGITFPIVAVDISGGYYVDILKMVYYPRMTCIILCYAIDDMMSFKNVFYWLEELRKHESTAPILLVATKIDLRSTCMEDLITTEQGLDLLQSCQATGFMECSIYSKESLEAVLQEGTRLSMIALREAYRQREIAAKGSGEMDTMGGTSTDINNGMWAAGNNMMKRMYAAGVDFMDTISIAVCDVMDIIFDRNKPINKYKRVDSTSTIDSDEDSTKYVSSNCCRSYHIQ